MNVIASTAWWGFVAIMLCAAMLDEIRQAVAPTEDLLAEQPLSEGRIVNWRITSLICAVAYFMAARLVVEHWWSTL